MAQPEPLIFNCPVEAALDAMGGKWKPVISWHLSQHDFRFGELRRAIPRVSQKVLVEQLRQLEKSGVVARHIEPTVPPMVSYSLTPHGETLKAGHHVAERVGRWSCHPDWRTNSDLGAPVSHALNRYSWFHWRQKNSWRNPLTPPHRAPYLAKWLINQEVKFRDI